MKRPSLLTRQDGFTLIEIIAVLILLGILAAVAVPKFIDLQSDAEVKAVQAVKAELNARANQYFAQYLLDNTQTANGQDLAAWALEDLGDDFALDDPVVGSLTVKVISTTNYYDIVFTQGTATAPAKFGAISENGTASF